MNPIMVKGSQLNSSQVIVKASSFGFFKRKEKKKKTENASKNEEKMGATSITLYQWCKTLLGV
jgi:hypothetical protein